VEELSARYREQGGRGLRRIKESREEGVCLRQIKGSREEGVV